MLHTVYEVTILSHQMNPLVASEMITVIKGHQLMLHQQAPQIKARTTAKEYRASAGEARGCGQLCIRAEDGVLVRRTTLDLPGSQTEVWAVVSWEAFSFIAVKWNWRRKQTRSLLISPQAQTNLVWVMGFSVVLFVCLFGLEPMDTQHAVKGKECRTCRTWRT